jgi:tripartite-type tricarboxylate transporter receptor subunit TctC
VTHGVPIIGRLSAVWLAAIALFASNAHAQTWPAKPIRFIMAAPAGSSIDVLGRLLAERIREMLGQPVVVENLPAAGGTTATAAVARASPDGYTLGIAFNGPLAYAPFLYARLPYDPVRDLQPIITTTAQPNVLAIPASLAARSVAELVDYAKARPGRLNYASVGNGSSSHLTMALFMAKAGIDIVHVPYNGSPPALNALANGDAQMLFAVSTAIAPLVQAGRVRTLAVTGARRFALLPELPTITESGVAGVEATAWNGVIAPAGTGSDVVDRLNRVLDAALREPSLRTRLAVSGLEAVGGTVAEFAALIRAEAERWAPIIRATGVRIE